MKPDTTYYVSCETPSTTAKIFISKNKAVNSVYGDTVSLGNDDWSRGRALTTDETGNLYIGTNQVVQTIADIDNVKAQIEEGSVKTGYEPYALLYTSQVEKNKNNITKMETDLSEVKNEYN